MFSVSQFKMSTIPLWEKKEEYEVSLLDENVLLKIYFNVLSQTFGSFILRTNLVLPLVKPSLLKSFPTPTSSITFSIKLAIWVNILLDYLYSLNYLFNFFFFLLNHLLIHSLLLPLNKYDLHLVFFSLIPYNHDFVVIYDV